MDGMILLQVAAAAGLTVRLDGNRLVIRGPRSADAIARRLVASKAAVVAAIQAAACSHTLHHADAASTWGPWSGTAAKQ
jgi:hypothetical protein